jgi:hypothetical protein
LKYWAALSQPPRRYCSMPYSCKPWNSYEDRGVWYLSVGFTDYLDIEIVGVMGVDLESRLNDLVVLLLKFLAFDVADQFGVRGYRACFGIKP